MPTVAEILKSAGMTDEQITAIDAKAVTAFEGVMTSAAEERNAAELAQRSAQDLFQNQITPALNEWGSKEATLSAERDYYKTLAEKAKTGGFIDQVPPFVPGQTRNSDGTFVAGGNPVPGSPSIDLKDLEGKLVGGLGALSDLQWRYRKLTGEEMPDSPTSLLAEAEANRLPFPEYAARKYDFAGKEKAIADKKAADAAAAIRKEERELVTREFTEKYGSNPNVRQGSVSQYAELRKGVSEGTRVDPLKMTPAERKVATSQAIRQDTANTMVQ